MQTAPTAEYQALAADQSSTTDNLLQSAPAKPESLQINHVGLLPPSVLSLLPDILPSSMHALLPEELLRTIGVESGQHVFINCRIATVYSTKGLFPVNSPSAAEDALSTVALLSPCLKTSLGFLKREDTALSIQPALDLPFLDSVTLTPLIPHPLAVHQSARAAMLAKNALLGREAREGDVISAALNLWCRVERAVGSGLVSRKTRVAIALRSFSDASSVTIQETVRAWAFAKWDKPVPWHLSSCSQQLAAAVDARLGIIVIEGLERDVADVIKVVQVGRNMTSVRWGSSKKVTEAVARLELGGGGAVALYGIEDDTVSVILSSAARYEGPTGHFHADVTKAQVSFVVVCDSKDDLQQQVLENTDLDITLPKATESERKDIIRESSGFRRIDMSEAQLEELVRMSAGFCRMEAHNLGLLRSRRDMGACRRSVRLFGKGKLTVNTGGVTWGDIGGLEDAKRRVMELVNLTQMAQREVKPTSEDTLSASTAINVSRRVGVLLYGPPGTGKTLLARAVAGECGCSFISVKGPELLDMYVGESEKNVRDVFERAIMAAPCVVFFDELDALAPSRGRGSDSGGVSDRVVSQLLAELDSIVALNSIFVIAASNRPDLVDPGLLRPGRLDKLVYVAMPSTREEQEVILRAQTRNFAFAEDVNYREILSFAPEPATLSGADIYALASNAWMQAAKRAVSKRSPVRTKDIGLSHGENVQSTHPFEASQRKCYDEWFLEQHGSSAQEAGDEYANGINDCMKVQLRHDDFLAAARALRPSLTMHQLQEYEELRERIEAGK